MLFVLIFTQAQRASIYDISAERNVWLQSALRSFAIVCDYMETGLFAVVCDLRSAICDRLRSYGNQPLISESLSVQSLAEVDNAKLVKISTLKLFLRVGSERCFSLVVLVRTEGENS